MMRWIGFVLFSVQSCEMSVHVVLDLDGGLDWTGYEAQLVMRSGESGKYLFIFKLRIHETTQRQVSIAPSSKSTICCRTELFDMSSASDAAVIRSRISSAFDALNLHRRAYTLRKKGISRRMGGTGYRTALPSTSKSSAGPNDPERNS